MSRQSDRAEGEHAASRTAHAMLVVWGLFAQEIGLVQNLEGVPIPQRKRDHAPQTKLIEFLVATLSGCKYLQDISHGTHPLDHDQAVADAWGQPRWADYSGVSRTMRACTAETVDAVREAIAEATRPFIDQEVNLALHREGQLVYDGDLTGRPVSSGSTTYPGAAYGWMDNALRFGYQAALVSMHSPTYGRLWLSVAHHPGDTVSSTQADKMVRAAESRTGARPLRRTQLLAERLKREREAQRQAQKRLEKCRRQYNDLWQQLQETAKEWREWQDEVAGLETVYHDTGRPEGPYSRLAKARGKATVRRRRLERLGPRLCHARRAVQKQTARVEEQRKAVADLQERHDRFTEENRSNRAPIRAVFRLDGGFGSGQNLAMLIEMGYEVYTKVLNANATAAIRRRATDDVPWICVGNNARITAWPQKKLPFCSYPLDVGLECFLVDGKEHYAALVHYGQEAVVEDLSGWFAFYNARQTIEAGIREGKQVFEMHHLKVRSLPGLAIQEEFAALSANLVRWAAVWLDQRCPRATQLFGQGPPSIKQMVRIAANTSASINRLSEDYLLLRFDELSAFRQTELRIGLNRGIQMPLPLFRNDVLSAF